MELVFMELELWWVNFNYLEGYHSSPLFFYEIITIGY